MAGSFFNIYTWHEDTKIPITRAVFFISPVLLEYLLIEEQWIKFSVYTD